MMTLNLMTHRPVTGLLRSKHSAAARAIYPLMTAVFITVFCHAGAVASDLTLPVVDALGVGPTWDGGVAAFDQEIDFASCIEDAGMGCPNVSWSVVESDDSPFLRFEYPGTGQLAGVYFKASIPQDFRVFQGGTLEIEARASEPDTGLTIKVDCEWPCSSGEIRLPEPLSDDWTTISINVDDLTLGGLDLQAVDTGLVFWPSDLGLVSIDIKRIVWRMTPASAALQRGTGGPLLLVNNLSGEENTSPIEYADMQLLWADEFDSNEVNLRDWNFDIGDNGWGNDEWQYYQPQNATLQNGHLVITAREQRVGASTYTSTRMKTEGEVEFTYARVDIRAALPEGQGIWPALWALGANFRQVGWPKTGELDIMEMIGGKGRENTVHGTMHWNRGGLSAPYSHTYQGGAYRLDSGQFSDGFHVFSMIRTAEGVTWLVDDQPFYTYRFSDAPDFEAFQKPFFLIFNIAVGGRWPGYPDDSTRFPQRLVVDYVRIFGAKASDEDSDGDGVEDPLDDLPLDPNDTVDTDRDGVGNAEDDDDDGDGYADLVDAYPLDATKWLVNQISEETDDASRSRFLITLAAVLFSKRNTQATP